MARIWQCGFEGGKTDILNVAEGGGLGPNISSVTPGFWSNYSNQTYFLSYSAHLMPGGPYTGEIFFRCYFFGDGGGTGVVQTGRIVSFWDSAGTRVAYLYYNGSMISAYRNDGTLLGSAGALNGVEWQLIEVRYKANNTTGIFDVRVNEIERLTFSGDTTSGLENFQTLEWGAGDSANYGGMLFDDMALNDTTTSNNNTWVGDGGIMGLFPSGAGDSTQWTPSAGSNYANVDEAPADEDTTYNHTATTGNKDLYTMDDLSALFTQVNAVQINVRSRKSPPGSTVIKGLMKSGVTEQLTAALELLSVFRTRGEVFNISPFTSTAWTDDEVNALQAGMKME